jgi:transposase
MPPVPEETARIARQAFPRGHPYLTMRDEFGAFFADEQFAALFPTRGQPAEAPWRLALVTLLQFAEGLSDRQAAEAVRSRIDWKYLLGLALSDPGFDDSVLCEFRARLLAGGATELLLETLLRHFQERKLLKERGKQRTDATHVLAAVRNLNRLELVGETLRQALNALATAAPEWLVAHSRSEWGQRYARSFADARLPQGRSEREALAVTVGYDGLVLLTAVYAPETAHALRHLPAVETLRQVWVQQFTQEEERLRWRTAEELPPAPLLLRSPTDPEARFSQKREQRWVGYKVHFTETCDPEAPLVITHVQTTAAPVPDTEVLPAIHACLAARKLLPAVHVVDRGYTEAETLRSSQTAYQVRLVGPVENDSSWQARAGHGFALTDFQVDWETRQVTCPLGKRSQHWEESRKEGRPVVKVRFAREDCQRCPGRVQCTRAACAGRQLTLLPEPEHQARQAARAYQQTEAFRQEYAPRAGIEGTHSQAVRRCGLRQCRYVGKAKVHLQHVLTAAALNFLRVAEWLRGTQRAQTRVSSFARLQAARA